MGILGTVITAIVGNTIENRKSSLDTIQISITKPLTLIQSLLLFTEYVTNHLVKKGASCSLLLRVFAVRELALFSDVFELLQGVDFVIKLGRLLVCYCLLLANLLRG